MRISEFIEQGANVQIVVGAIDLKEAFIEWSSKQVKAEPKAVEEEKYFTAEETAKRLRVDISTLWRWGKNGYLPKVKMGGLVRYKESDIKKVEEGAL